MVFQQSNGIHLGLRTGKVKEIWHQFISIGSLFEVGFLPAIVAVITAGIIAVATLPMARPFPITHDLAHRIGHTARLAVTTVNRTGVFGSHVIVEVGLVPNGRK